MAQGGCHWKMLVGIIIPCDMKPFTLVSEEERLNSLMVPVTQKNIF